MSEAGGKGILTDKRRQNFGVEGHLKIGLVKDPTTQEFQILEWRNNQHAVPWIDEVRMAYFFNIGLDREGMRGKRVMPLSTAVRYTSKPLKIGRRAVITARARSIRDTSAIMEYGIWSEGCHCECVELFMLVAKMNNDMVPFPEPSLAMIRQLDAPEEKLGTYNADVHPLPPSLSEQGLARLFQKRKVKSKAKA